MPRTSGEFAARRSGIDGDPRAFGFEAQGKERLCGAGDGNQALNNEEFPFYYKLHRDFSYDSLKNLSADLSLPKCFELAFTLCTTGYYPIR